MSGRETHPLDLLREVLDHELVDAEGVSCGMVDDIEFEDTPRGPVPAALVAGPGAWGPRLPALLALCARRLFGSRRVRVPWTEVHDIGETIRLKCRAEAVGLGTVDRKVERWLSRWPGA
jgi:sporulation protein YlmC with PRC-barrel domain